MRTVWPFKRPGGENRYHEVRCDSINGCEILAFVPEAPCREDDMFIGHASAHRHRTSAITDDSRCLRKTIGLSRGLSECQRWREELVGRSIPSCDELRPPDEFFWQR